MRALVCCLLITGMFAPPVYGEREEPAAPAVDLKVERIETGTGVAERKIVGSSNSFPANVASVYCLTHVTGAKGETSISHVWYQDDQERARVKLPVRSTSWRTWSSKKIPAYWSGPWRVVVLDAAGREIGSTSFTVGE
jgi:hypothetical protein